MGNDQQLQDIGAEWPHLARALLRLQTPGGGLIIVLVLDEFAIDDGYLR